MEKHAGKIILTLFTLLLISLGFNIYYNLTDKEVKIEEKTDTIYSKDTIRDTIPSIKQEKILLVQKETLKVDKIIHDTIDNTVVVDIPISQKEYSDDSTYTAWVSGYKPKLDSINIYRKNTIINHEITITKKDNKKWGIGPVIYGGYDISNKKIGWGVGIGITYNVVKW